MSLLAGLALAPLARGQDAARLKTVGIFMPGTMAGFRGTAMPAHGWVEGKTVRYAMRKVAEDSPDLDQIAAELVSLNPDVLVTQGAALTLALQRATRKIPIVTAGISDPVSEGVARTLARPGMNVTGLSFGLPESSALQLGALRALRPSLRRVVFVETETTADDRPTRGHEAAAKPLGLALERVRVKDSSGLERLLGTLREATDAAWIALLPRDTTFELAAGFARRARVATHGRGLGSVRAGILMSFWTTHSNPLARVAAQADMVLRGADPAGIPFELPDRTSFALNRTTAKAIGIDIPLEVLIRVTDLID